MRKTFEFYCTECRKYFDVKLDVSTNGYFRIHCPSCGHTHYRAVKDGKITDERFTTRPDKDTPLLDDIYPMKSSCRDVQHETYLDNSFDTAGFMRRLWKEKFVNA